jgi:hypothetical protein
MAVCFSKPSLVLLPLVLFRAWRHKEYLLGFILSFSIGLQTLLFLTSSYFLRLPDQASIPILEKILSIVLYPGMVLLKILHAPTPTFFIVMCVSAMIVLLYISLTRILGWRVSVVLGTTVGLLVYTSLFSPDSPMPSLFHNLNTLYTDTSKLQRDILLQALLLLLLFVGYYHFVVILKKRFAIKIFQANAIYLVAPFVFLLLLYRPIDVSSAGLALNNLQQFKGDLRKVTADCMPISPTPLWYTYAGTSTPTYGWYFESHSYGTCGRSNYIKVIDPNSFVSKLDKPLSISIGLDQPHEMRAIALAVRTPNAKDSPVLRLENTVTHKTYIAKISPRQNDTMAYVVFNITGDPPAASYLYLLSSDNPAVTTGKFTDNTLMHYAYYSLLY